MAKTANDISDTLAPKSDQLNADDLIGGPIVVKILGVKRTSDEQPVVLEIDGGHKPWKPCKTMRRLMTQAWPDCVVPPPKGSSEKPKVDATKWIGRSVMLVRDPAVKWGGETVGGIRIGAMSHIAKRFEASITESQRKKKMVTVDRLDLGHEKVRQSQSTAPQESGVVSKLALEAMKESWKAGRRSLEQTVSADDFGAFVEEVTSGLVPSSAALKCESYSAEQLAACEAAVKAMAGENF